MNTHPLTRDVVAAALRTCSACCLDNDPETELVLARLMEAIEPVLRKQYTAGYQAGIQTAVDLIRRQG